MTVSETIAVAGQRTNKNTSSSDVFARFLNHLNLTREIAWDKYDWSWKKRALSIRTYDQVNTGTVTVTNGSQTITHSGTGFSSPYVGGYIRVLGSIPESWYKVIAVVSSSVLTIEILYQWNRCLQYLPSFHLAAANTQGRNVGRIIRVVQHIRQARYQPVWIQEPLQGH